MPAKLTDREKSPPLLDDPMVHSNSLDDPMVHSNSKNGEVAPNASIFGSPGPVLLYLAAQHRFRINL